MSAETVGSLLADIATSLQDGLRSLMFADKRGWGPDEFEQVRALEESLDDAKKDFQELAPLVNGQYYYENDRRPESLHELRLLASKIDFHTKNFKEWLKAGGPINPVWVRETIQLRRELHRAQCRAARRIYNAHDESSQRCLGAFLVYRRQRDLEAQKKRDRERRATLPTWSGPPGPDNRDQQRPGQEQLRQSPLQPQSQWPGATEMNGLGSPGGYAGTDGGSTTESVRRMSLEDLVPDCNEVGVFERFGDRDIAFICDYCDGHIVWEDIDRMPSTRSHISHPAASPLSPGSRSPPAPSIPTAENAYPNWQATALTHSTHQPKQTIFAPLVIANHLPPARGGLSLNPTNLLASPASGGGTGWEARMWCPYCDEYTYYDGGDEDQAQYAQDENGFASLKSFQMHLEWYHSAIPLSEQLAAPLATSAAPNCGVM